MPGCNFKGFSLIEVLVVVALIGIVVGVSIPNLRQFSSTQEIDAAASQLVNAFRTAQSSSVSHIKCPGGEVSSGWNVVLKPAEYVVNCTASGTDRKTYSSAYVAVENSVTPFGMTNICATDQELKFIFTGQRLSYQCGAILGTSWPVRVTLRNTSGNVSKVIVVEAGGVIRTE